MKQQKSIHISIPQPCTEDWDTMTPKKQGRFCDKCQKCVVDFTSYSDKELLNYFALYGSKNLCGRFDNSQLNRKIFTPPTRRSYFQWIMSLTIVVFLSNLLGFEARAQEPVKKEWKQDDKKENTGDSTKNSEYLEKLPTRNTSTMVSTSVGGMHFHYDSSAISIGGGRGDGLLYIIDGVQIQGNREINNISDGVDIIVPPASGTPASYSNKEREK